MIEAPQANMPVDQSGDQVSVELHLLLLQMATALQKAADDIEALTARIEALE